MAGRYRGRVGCGGRADLDAAVALTAQEKAAMMELLGPVPRLCDKAINWILASPSVTAPVKAPRLAGSRLCPVKTCS